MASGNGLSGVTPDVWDRLADEPLAGDALAARCAAPQLTDRLLAALDRQGGRHLLVSLTSQEAEYSDRRSRGIKITTRELALADGTRGRYLDLTCRDPMGFDVFDALGSEFGMALAAEIEEPAVAARRLVSKWRRFWTTSSGPLLSREQQVGLFAELWFLAFWLVPKVGLVQSVDAWRGPLGARHDIELPTCSIEVKASTSDAGRTHRIHGIDQLAVPQDGKLFLFSLAVREDGGGANTLPGLVELIRDLASNDDDGIIRFETRLAHTGYLPSAVADYADLRFRVVDERLYRVEDPFPRLLRRSLLGGMPAGVEEVSYSINLAGFDSHLVATEPEGFPIA